MLVLYSSCFHVSFSIDSSDRAFAGDLEAVIATSDVILEVLDARDPLGTRCVNIEKRVRDSGTYKRHVLLLNKIGKFLDHLFPFWEYFFHWLIICASNSDLVPRESVEKWLKYLREEFPTVAFKCSTQQQKSNLGRSKKIKTSNTLQLSDCLGAETLLKLLKNYARSDKVTEDYFYVQCSCPLFLFFMFLFLWCLQVFL